MKKNMIRNIQAFRFFIDLKVNGKTQNHIVCCIPLMVSWAFN